MLSLTSQSTKNNYRQCILQKSERSAEFANVIHFLPRGYLMKQCILAIIALIMGKSKERTQNIVMRYDNNTGDEPVVNIWWLCEVGEKGGI